MRLEQERQTTFVRFKLALQHLDVSLELPPKHVVEHLHLIGRADFPFLAVGVWRVEGVAV